MMVHHKHKHVPMMVHHKHKHSTRNVKISIKLWKNGHTYDSTMAIGVTVRNGLTPV